MVPPVASCYQYQDKFWLAGSFCLSRDFAFTFSTVRIKSLIKKKMIEKFHYEGAGDGASRPGKNARYKIVVVVIRF